MEAVAKQLRLRNDVAPTNTPQSPGGAREAGPPSCASAARANPSGTRHPHPGRPLSSGGRPPWGIGPVQKQWTVQLVPRSTSPNSPLLRRRQLRSCQSCANPSGNPGTHHQPGVRVAAPMGHAGAWPLRPVVPCGGPPKPSQSTPRPARQPPGRTAQALRDPAGHLPHPRSFRPAPVGGIISSPCPHTSAFPRVTTDPGTIDNRACC